MRARPLAPAEASIQLVREWTGCFHFDVRPSGVLVKWVQDLAKLPNVTYRVFVDSRVRRICQSRGGVDPYLERGLAVVIVAVIRSREPAIR